MLLMSRVRTIPTRLVSQVVNICVDVLTEGMEEGGKRLREGLGQMYSGEGMDLRSQELIDLCPLLAGLSSRPRRFRLTRRPHGFIRFSALSGKLDHLADLSLSNGTRAKVTLVLQRSVSCDRCNRMLTPSGHLRGSSLMSFRSSALNSLPGDSSRAYR